mmetsp:Transcript_21747/g.33183  ORF Transcript_21747/g.33183 Transcript_21747/m.33183 type:complete len:252 (+) Transcript_21747:148-903(+)
MVRKKQNYYQERPAASDEFRRHNQSRDLASSRIDQLAMLPLAEKKVLIRQLLQEIGTDVDQNDGDPTGNGDQTTISTVERRDVARHLFATGGDMPGAQPQFESITKFLLWKEHKNECVDLSSLSGNVTLGSPSEFDDGLCSMTQSLRGGSLGRNFREDVGYKKPRGTKFNEKFVIKCQGNADTSPILIYDQTRTCQFSLKPEKKGFKEILQTIRNEPAWQGRKSFMKASFDKSGVCTVYPEKAGVKSHYTW